MTQKFIQGGPATCWTSPLKAANWPVSSFLDDHSPVSREIANYIFYDGLKLTVGLVGSLKR